MTWNETLIFWTLNNLLDSFVKSSLNEVDVLLREEKLDSTFRIIELNYVFKNSLKSIFVEKKFESKLFKSLMRKFDGVYNKFMRLIILLSFHIINGKVCRFLFVKLAMEDLNSSDLLEEL
jgi:hypothetical protein